MLPAAGLPRSVSTSKLTFCPSLSESIPAFCTALMWTKTSFEPSLGWMKPKPFWVLKNFTVPIAITVSLLGSPASRSSRTGQPSEFWEVSCRRSPNRGGVARQQAKPWLRGAVYTNPKRGVKRHSAGMVDEFRTNSMELRAGQAVMPALKLMGDQHDLGQRRAAVADRNSAADHHSAGAVLALARTGFVLTTSMPPAHACWVASVLA